MSPERAVRHFRIALCAFVGTILVGSVVFRLILHEPYHAALYRSVVTISLTGIDTVPRGVGGEAATIVLILAGMAIYGYLATLLVELITHGIVTGAWADKRRRRAIERLSGHFIICGYGRVGQRVGEEFRRTDTPYVVVDFSPEALAAAREHGDLLVEGTGTEDENLEEAGLPHAKGLVVASDDDADNLYITLSARTARPDLLIVARATDEEAAKKIRVAGADRVVEPYLTAGREMASLALKPQVQALVDVMTDSPDADFRFEEIRVLPGSGPTGRTIGDLQVHTKTGAYIVGLRKGSGEFDTTPGPQAVLDDGDVVVAVGTRDELQAVEDLFASNA